MDPGPRLRVGAGRPSAFLGDGGASFGLYPSTPTPSPRTPRRGEPGSTTLTAGCGTRGEVDWVPALTAGTTVRRGGAFAVATCSGCMRKNLATRKRGIT